METKELLETIELRKAELNGMKYQQSQLSADISTLAAHIANLEKQANGAYQGRNRYTDVDRQVTRRAIRSVVSSGALSMGDICQRLPLLDRGLIEQEVNYLHRRNALVWNGGHGPASKYALGNI